MEPSAQQPVISPEDVLESLMNDGTIDAMRLKIITQLKANEELKNTTMKMVEQSKVLNTPGAEKQTKRELFDALRQELETPVLEKASKSTWDLILDEDGLGKEINETVEKVFCRLSGREPPLFTETSESRSEKGKEKETGSSGGGGGGGGVPDTLMYYNSDLPSKKRKLDGLIIQESPGEIAGSSASLNDTTIQVLPPKMMMMPLPSTEPEVFHYYDANAADIRAYSSLGECWNALGEIKSCSQEIFNFFNNNGTSSSNDDDDDYNIGPDCCKAIATITRLCWPAMLATLGITTDQTYVLRGYCDEVSTAPPAQGPAPAA